MADSRPTPSLVDALHGVLRQAAEPNHVLRVILEQAVAQTGAERGLFVEVEETGRLEYSVLHGFAPKQLEGDAGGYSRTLFARVIETGAAVRLEHISEDPTLAPIESIRVLRAAAILCVPIRAGDRIAALVHLEHRQRGHFTEAHQMAIEALAGVAGPVLAALRAGRQILRERDHLREAETRLRSEAEVSRRQLAEDWSFGRFVGRSSVVRGLESVVRRVAASSAPVLLVGESGTGKGLIARILHSQGPRATKPFVTVFCPSLERGMVEAELFGHRRGAFTGATADRPGKVAEAEGGTLFLDEIGELPLELQPKLLRLLQEKTYERVGDAKEMTADVRIIAATNRELEREVEAGRFRRDLFERLNYVPLEVPPLRQRREDLPLLLRHALDRVEGGRWIEISPEAEHALVELDFAWPGNVRHIEQLAARLALGGASSPVSATDLLARLQPAAAGRAIAESSTKDLSAGLPALLEESERGWLEHALSLHPGLTRAELATRLKISESALYKKLKQYGLT
jgi:transcriptional regulator with GAF, ATPase, and Fis domain